MTDSTSAWQGRNFHYDGTGNADAVVVQKVHTKVTVDYDLVRQCQLAGDKPHKGTPVGTLPELYPFDMLKRPLLGHVEEFVSQIGTKGYYPVGSIYSFEVWGPYTEKVGEMRDWVPEAGNHLISNPRSASKVWGIRSDELDWSMGATFIIVGEFSRAAKHGQQNERGEILV